MSRIQRFCEAFIQGTFPRTGWVCVTPHRMAPQLMEDLEFGLFSYIWEAKVELGLSIPFVSLSEGHNLKERGDFCSTNITKLQSMKKPEGGSWG